MSLNKKVLEIRQRQKIKSSDLDKPSAVWTGKDLLNDKLVDTLTIILRTSGCWWGKVGGCTMCGYVYDSAQNAPTEENLLVQFNKALQKADNFENYMIKIFTSGSFLDIKEIPINVREKIFKIIDADKRILKVIVESRPEFVTNEILEECTYYLKNTQFEIAIGLETSSDFIRKNAINKAFTLKSFIQAAHIAKANKVSVKTYLMLKPLFLSEKDAMEDIINSVREIATYSNTISINLCNVQRGTLIEYLWERGEYRPPWLWSIVEILKITKKEFPFLIITSDPVGAGAKRGPRNCKTCSSIVSDGIRNFSQTQDVKHLENLMCDCKYLWQTVIDLDGLTFGSPIKQ